MKKISCSLVQIGDLLPLLHLCPPCWTVCEVQFECAKNYVCYQLHLLMQVYLWLLSHTHLGYSDCPTIPCRPVHVSCLTKRRSFRSSTYYGLHDIVLSYMGLSHIHMHMRIHACRLSIHGTRMLGPCMSSWQGMAHACKVHAGLDIERPTG